MTALVLPDVWAVFGADDLSQLRSYECGWFHFKWALVLFCREWFSGNTCRFWPAERCPTQCLKGFFDPSFQCERVLQSPTKEVNQVSLGAISLWGFHFNQLQIFTFCKSSLLPPFGDGFSKIYTTTKNTRTLWGRLLLRTGCFGEACWGSPDAGAPVRVSECPWQEVTATVLVGECSFNTLTEASLALCISAQPSSDGRNQTLSRVYGLRLQGVFQFNEYPRKYLMPHTSLCL